MFEQSLENLTIEHRKISALWLQANGEVKRLKKSLLKRTRIAHAEGKKWQKGIRKYLVA